MEEPQSSSAILIRRKSTDAWASSGNEMVRSTVRRFDFDLSVKCQCKRCIDSTTSDRHRYRVNETSFMRLWRYFSMATEVENYSLTV